MSFKQFVHAQAVLRGGLISGLNEEGQLECSMHIMLLWRYTYLRTHAEGVMGYCESQRLTG